MCIVTAWVLALVKALPITHCCTSCPVLLYSANIASKQPDIDTWLPVCVTCKSNRACIKQLLCIFLVPAVQPSTDACTLWFSDRFEVHQQVSQPFMPLLDNSLQLRHSSNLQKHKTLLNNTCCIPWGVQFLTSCFCMSPRVALCI